VARDTAVKKIYEVWLQENAALIRPVSKDTCQKRAITNPVGMSSHAKYSVKRRACSPKVSFYTKKNVRKSLLLRAIALTYGGGHEI
jgi:hypothetical protein